MRPSPERVVWSGFIFGILTRVIAQVVPAFVVEARSNRGSSRLGALPASNTHPVVASKKKTDVISFWGAAGGEMSFHCPPAFVVQKRWPPDADQPTSLVSNFIDPCWPLALVPRKATQIASRVSTRG